MKDPWVAVPKPPVKRRCRACMRTWKWTKHLNVVVSTSGIAHEGKDYGMTACGKDATGPGWWWPL